MVVAAKLHARKIGHTLFGVFIPPYMARARIMRSAGSEKRSVKKSVTKYAVKVGVVVSMSISPVNEVSPANTYEAEVVSDSIAMHLTSNFPFITSPFPLRFAQDAPTPLPMGSVHP